MPYPFTTWVEEEQALQLAKEADPRAGMPFVNTWIDTIKHPEAVLTFEEYLKWVVGDGWVFHAIRGGTVIMCGRTSPY